MKCPGCDYELWNLKAGPCPECGRPFKPSEFDLLPNAVKFCCPHCSQTYYGTSEHGMLEPAEFDCVSCGKRVTIDEMLLLPADALGTRVPTQSRNPWLDSNRKIRWFSTIGAGIGQPGRLLEATPAFGSSSRATSFALLNFFAAGLFGIAMALLMSFSGGGSGAVAFLTIAGALIIGPLVYMGFWTLITHAVLKLCRQPTPDGIGRTYQAIAFTSGSWLFTLLPCLGPPVGFVAWSACAPAAVRGAHGCKIWAAIVATLIPPVLVSLSVVGLYIAMIVGVAYSAQSMSSFQQTWAAQSQLDFESVLLANELRTRVKAASPPLHGASLLGQNSMVPYFVFEDSTTFDIPIGNEFASTLSSMSEPKRRAELQAITSTWPADVTAHRIGRIVFTHHGIAPSDDPALWIMIELPNTPGDTIADAVHLDGASMFDTATGSTFEIDQQNQLRANSGLPPLPDFQTLMSGTGPWTAADGAPLPAPPGGP